MRAEESQFVCQPARPGGTTLFNRNYHWCIAMIQTWWVQCRCGVSWQLTNYWAFELSVRMCYWESFSNIVLFNVYLTFDRLRRAPHEMIIINGVPHQIPVGLNILRKYLLTWRFEKTRFDNFFIFLYLLFFLLFSLFP